ncbi:MAG: hypothetical protein JSU08_14660 [Acidobacteria bacterium]|nr:hypothetical protein [Acidobacteriota bacterium]
MRPDIDQAPRPDQTADLELALISEFLERRGQTLHSIHTLPEAERHAIMREASLYASSRLSEVESRAHFVDDLHQK